MAYVPSRPLPKIPLSCPASAGGWDPQGSWVPLQGGAAGAGWHPVLLLGPLGAGLGDGAHCRVPAARHGPKSALNLPWQ